MLRIFTRRELLKFVGTSLFSKTGNLFAIETTGVMVTEDQKGDPGASYEHVTFDREHLDELVSGGGKAIFEQWKKFFPAAMLGNARKFIGYSRETTPEQISEFLRLFGLPFKDARGYIAFCAAGLAFCAGMAYADLLGITYNEANRISYIQPLLPDIEHWYYYPTVSCMDIFHVAAGKHRWLDRKSDPSAVPKPGWLVLFDWRKNGHADHCGIISHATKEKIYTVEFNTSGKAGDSQRDGGVVAERERDYDDFIKGFVVTDLPPGGRIS